MIPVPPKAEPADFDRKVRKPGQKWLRDNNIVPGAPPPDASKLPPYWRETQKTLWNAMIGYARICAFTSTGRLEPGQPIILLPSPRMPDKRMNGPTTG